MGPPWHFHSSLVMPIPVVEGFLFSSPSCSQNPYHQPSNLPCSMRADHIFPRHISVEGPVVRLVSHSSLAHLSIQPL